MLRGPKGIREDANRFQSHKGVRERIKSFSESKEGGKGGKVDQGKEKGTKEKGMKKKVCKELKYSKRKQKNMK